MEGLLTQSYKAMQINYTPKKEDVAKWLAASDKNKDGVVTLDEYEGLVLKTLEKSGIKLN